MAAVTVVVPLYNKGPHVERALSSILGQTFQDFQVIVVDDGSTDNGPAVVTGLSNERINLVSRENGGPGAARNTGLAMVDTPFVTFLDADDEQLPTFLQTTVDFLGEHSECVAVSTGFYLHPSNRSSECEWGGYGLTDKVCELDPSMPARLAHYAQAYMSPCTTLARTDVLRRFGGFYAEDHCTYGEDQYLFLKVALNCAFGIIMEPHVVVHLEASELARSDRPKRPVFPFLLDPGPIYAVCPAEKHILLGRMLEYKASVAARHYLQDAIPPDVQTAKMLLAKHPYVGGHLWHRFVTRFWLYLPPLARVIRRLKWAMKGGR